MPQKHSNSWVKRCIRKKMSKNLYNCKIITNIGAIFKLDLMIYL